MAFPPFMNSTGLIGKIFEKIQQAKVPPRYTQDFQSTVLGFGSGSARPFIPFLKRLNFIQSDGTPTELYTRFRNADSSGAAMAEAMRIGFADIFQKNEFANDLTDDKLKNLVVEVTGKEPGDGTVSAIVGSFKPANSWRTLMVLMQPRRKRMTKPRTLRSPSSSMSQRESSQVGISVSDTPSTSTCQKRRMSKYTTRYSLRSNRTC